MAGVDTSVQHTQQPATNVHGLNGGGHPHRGATAPRRKIIARVQELIPDMQASGGGALICTGNTSAYRGKPRFAGVAPTKAAQRILLESIAREAGPHGIHAAYVAIDAVIDLEWTRKFFADKPDEFFCQPSDIAEEVFRMAHQPRSAWSFESVIRPFGEVW